MSLSARVFRLPVSTRCSPWEKVDLGAEELLLLVKCSPFRNDQKGDDEHGGVDPVPAENLT